MTIAAELSYDDGTVRGRLIRAADDEIAERGSTAVQMEAIAKRAGVSRATAFRQLGSMSEVLVQVALLRSRKHVAAVRDLMADKAGVFAKIEAALIYTTHHLPTDPSISALIAQHSTSVRDPQVHGVAVDVMGPVLREGQHSGEIRTDLHLDELIDHLVEQTYLAAEDQDRSPAAVRRRFRHFIIPALERRGGAGGEYVSRTIEVEAALAAAREALENFAEKLGRGAS
jgi:AcrR family transcriptional regulator